MAADGLSSLVGLCAASFAIALSLPQTASADTPSWNGEYAITRSEEHTSELQSQ